jgi:hypothetical protein
MICILHRLKMSEETRKTVEAISNELYSSLLFQGHYPDTATYEFVGITGRNGDTHITLSDINTHKSVEIHYSNFLQMQASPKQKSQLESKV